MDGAGDMRSDVQGEFAHLRSESAVRQLRKPLHSRRDDLREACTNRDFYGQFFIGNISILAEFPFGKLCRALQHFCLVRL